MNRTHSDTSHKRLSLKGLSPAIKHLVKLGQMTRRRRHNLHTHTVPGFRCSSNLIEEIKVRRVAEDRNHSNFMRRALRHYLASEPSHP